MPQWLSESDLVAIKRGGPRRCSVQALDAICDELVQARHALIVHGIAFTTLRREPGEEDDPGPDGDNS